MELEKITMPREAAKEAWKCYNVILQTRKEKYLKDMKSAMFAMKEGHELIDIYKVMEKAGVNKFYQPRLAIARADWREVFFRKRDEGRGTFAADNNGWHTSSDGSVSLQPKTFMNWLRQRDATGKESTWSIDKESIKTKTPVIPAHLFPEGKLESYYVLWEPKTWEDLPETKDPLLLKRITENLFVILAAWDVTELEQSVINGATQG